MLIFFITDLLKSLEAVNMNKSHFFCVLQCDRVFFTIIMNNVIFYAMPGWRKKAFCLHCVRFKGTDGVWTSSGFRDYYYVDFWYFYFLFIFFFFSFSSTNGAQLSVCIKCVCTTKCDKFRKQNYNNQML